MIKIQTLLTEMKLLELFHSKLPRYLFIILSTIRTDDEDWQLFCFLSTSYDLYTNDNLLTQTQFLKLFFDDRRFYLYSISCIEIKFD